MECLSIITIEPLNEILVNILEIWRKNEWESREITLKLMKIEWLIVSFSKHIADKVMKNKVVSLSISYIFINA